MLRTPIPALPGDIPASLQARLRGAPVFDSSSSPDARVYLIEREGGLYLKAAQKGALAAEAAMTDYFHRKGLGAQVLAYISDARDWLLTRAVPGEDCTHQTYLADPARLCDTLAEALRMLHDTPCGDCPVPARTQDYIATVRANFAAGRFDARYAPSFRSAQDAYDAFCAGSGALACDALIHGDACLPNVMLRGWRFSGFIDVGNGGRGERHIDLFWALWSLAHNLKTDAYGARFLDAYGRERVDMALLQTIAAAECFG